MVFLDVYILPRCTFISELSSQLPTEYHESFQFSESGDFRVMALIQVTLFRYDEI